MSVLNAKTTVVVMLAALAFAVCGEGVNLLDLIRESEETPAPGRIRRSNAQIVERVVRREVTNTVVRVVEKPVVVEKQVVVEKPVVVEKKVVVEREVTNTVEKIVEKVVEKPVFVEKKVIVEVPVEKTVVDRQAEEQLMKQLEQERTLNAEVKRTMKRPVDSSRSKQASKITSASTYYDRKNGFVIFDRNVHVDDPQYQLHADKAYVFLDATNEVRRIVAQGHVAMTNDTKRAYGAKVSYYRQNGMVVLYAGDGIVAEVRDAAKGDDQVVRGSKIKFWIGSEQVEVLDADISASRTGGAGIGDILPTGGKKSERNRQ